MQYDDGICRKAIEDAADAIIFLNDQAYPEYINRAGIELTGYELKELQELHTEEWILAPLVAEPGVVRYISLEDILPSERKIAEDYVFVHHQHGIWLPVHMRLVKVPDEDGLPAGYITYLKDARALMNMLDRMSELEQHALIDTLTGLPNRRNIEQEIQMRLDAFRRYEHAMALFILDIDHFKDVNDNYGHNLGDLVLRNVASVIRGSLRTPDVVGRWGGEEFVGVLAGAATNAIEDVLERIRKDVAAARLEFQGQTISVTASIGATVPMDTDTPRTCMQRADTALYTSKETGRNRVTIA
jgi:diguanylate cyclase (GGDEF)-like protein/PAS domain S-box-containing protein